MIRRLRVEHGKGAWQPNRLGICIMPLLWLRHWLIASTSGQAILKSRQVRQYAMERPKDLCTADDNSSEYSGSVGEWNKAVSQQ